MIRMIATKKAITEHKDNNQHDNDVAAVKAKDSGQDTKVDTTNDNYNIDDELKQSERRVIFQLLLDSGRCKVNQGEMHGCTAIWYAAGGGWPGAVEALLKAGAVVDPVLSHLPGMGTRYSTASPLMRAIDCGNYATAKLLLDHGARVVESVLHGLDMSHLPKDLVEALHTRAAADTTVLQCTESQESGPRFHDNDTVACVGYERTRKCVPVPFEAFAIPPPPRD